MRQFSLEEDLDVSKKTIERMLTEFVNVNKFSEKEHEAARTVAAVYNARGSARLADATEIGEIKRILYWTGINDVNYYSIVPLIWKYQTLN